MKGREVYEVWIRMDGDDGGDRDGDGVNLRVVSKVFVNFNLSSLRLNEYS